MDGMSERVSPSLQVWIHRPFGANVGAMDGRVFAGHRVGKAPRAYAWWKPAAPEVTGWGGPGLIRIVPRTPALWTHLKPGVFIALVFQRRTAPAVPPRTENQA
jgi:hypothetical protein